MKSPTPFSPSPASFPKFVAFFALAVDLGGVARAGLAPAVGGVVSGCGSLTRRNGPPAERDAPVVEKLRAAGAIIPGKTHTVEYAFGGYGTNVTVGTPWNPWDRKVHRIPGGSSSGSAAAVSHGLVDFAPGTDTGGSVRAPANHCGWFTRGLPTFVRVADTLLGPAGSDCSLLALAEAVEAG